MCFYQVIIFIFIVNCVVPEQKDKRILLSDENLLAKELLFLRAEVDSLKNSSKPAGVASTYVRWGRTSCPGDNELVYEGYTAGNHYTTSARGTGTVCLPKKPTWANYVDGSTDHRNYLHGTEIDVNEPNHIFPYPVNEQDMPCVVCKVPRAVTLMIPASTQCIQGWTEEYSGYLMSSAGSNDHLCMDSRPEFSPHGGTNDDEHILYLVEAQCGSLPCPPYVHGRELACIVCSK